MNYRSLTISLSLLFLSSISAHGQTPGPIPKQSVIAAEGNWLRALYNADVSSLQAIESKDFILITPPGMTTREAHLAILRQRLSKGPPEPTKYSVDQRKVLIYGPVAIIIDALLVTSAGAHPITSSGRYWQTEIWHSEGGHWKLVHVHLTPAARRRM
jgi:ketosteroid isomerase-like protein